MGTASQVNNVFNEVWWYYGFSRVVFRQGHVTEWANTSGNLKVRWNSSTAPPPAPTAYTPAAQRFSLPVARGGTRHLYSYPSDGHWIKSKSDDGDIITLEDGSVWKVDPLDQIDSSLWLPMTEITVVESDDGYLLINTDDGEKVGAELLHQ
jgi:hypothetical protein